MEDVVQRVFAILLSVLIFFLLPLYIAFEKKDDIAYALALKITTKFVDQVTESGYLTMEMYDNYLGELATTGNVYEVKMEYTAKQYNPVIQILGEKTGSNGKSVIVKEYDYMEKKDEYEKYENEKVKDIFLDAEREVTGFSKTRSTTKAQLTYKLSDRKFSTDQILTFLNGSDNFVPSNTSSYSTKTATSMPANPRIYGLRDEGIMTLNTGDQFTITVRNTNTTIASMLFNTLTLGANSGNDTKVYINYGTTVKNQEYKVPLRGDINQDAVLDSRDNALIDEYIRDKSALTTVQKIIADRNGDGVINSSDKN